MNITQVRLTKLENSKTLALASITLDNSFVVTGLRVLESQTGFWVAMPSKKNKEGSDKPYSDIAYPITKEAREQIQTAVLTEYQKSSYDRTPYQPSEEQKQVYKELHSERPVIDVTEDDLPF